MTNDLVNNILIYAERFRYVAAHLYMHICLQTFCYEETEFNQIQYFLDECEHLGYLY